MLKNFFIAGLFLMSFTVIAQEKPSFEDKGDLVEATYYFDNGQVEQQGTFKDGKLHGTWTSFDLEGNKVAVGNYEDGVKVGKWFFWSNDVLHEVDYIDSKIVNVNEWQGRKVVAFRN